MINRNKWFIPPVNIVCVSIKYHDMNDVVDFLVLKHNYEASVQVTEDVKKVIFLMAGPLRPPPPRAEWQPEPSNKLKLKFQKSCLF